MHPKSLPLLALLLLFAVSGCKKEAPIPDPLPVNITGQKVYVVCEGSLGNGNSALGLYLPDKDSAYMDVYKAANGESLGDIFQSMTRIGNQYFLCVNNSDKIIVINKDSWKKEGPGVSSPGLIGINKPRYILPVAEEKAYVTSLFHNNLYLIHPGNQVNYGSIQLPYLNAEGMVRIADTVYVACWDTACTSLLRYNVKNDQPIQPIAIPASAPQELLIDAEQKIWVLSGNVSQGRAAALTRINPVTGDVLNSYAFPSGADPLRPVFNAGKDTLYFIEANYNGGSTNNGIFRMAIHANALPDQPFIAAQGFQYFWALGIQPGTGYIYVGDPKGFTQRGAVNIYKQDGSLIKSFLTGIGPGHFYFDQ